MQHIVNVFTASIFYRSCGAWFGIASKCKRHEQRCERGPKYKYVEGPFRTPQNVFQKLESFGICIPDGTGTGQHSTSNHTSRNLTEVPPGTYLCPPAWRVPSQEGMVLNVLFQQGTHRQSSMPCSTGSWTQPMKWLNYNAARSPHTSNKWRPWLRIMQQTATVADMHSCPMTTATSQSRMRKILILSKATAASLWKPEQIDCWTNLFNSLNLYLL